MSKLEAENKAIMERVGLRWVYGRLLSSGVLNTGTRAPIEDVRGADAEVALRILADQNAGV
jgi:hypothetical protein